MRNVATVVTQVFVCVVLSGALVPAILAAAPNLAETRYGMTIVLVLPILIFLTLRLVWPRRRT